MRIDPSTFFILVGTLAAGGAGGFYASQKHLIGPPPPPPPAPPPAVTVYVPTAVSSAPAPRPSPSCDDAVGMPGACPAPGYSADETGCGALPTKRCNDFKQTMKPKVADHAVACLNALTPDERCDKMRLNLCGHLALTNACMAPEDETADASAEGASLAAACQAIHEECSGAALGPPMADCRATLSGMSEAGRKDMIACMKKHCSDKGLVGCEAVVDVK
jgi:hypothetical protein